MISLIHHLSSLTTNGLLRDRLTIDTRNNNSVVINHKPLISFCSNDYLNLSSHPKIKKAFIQGVNQYGLGSGASTQISGYLKAHAMLEETFAEFIRHEKAILFGSGYLANIGIVTALANRNTAIIADKLCHASLIDGILLSKANYHRYRHQDFEHAERLLQQAGSKALLITESIFSMEGSLTNIKKLAKLASHYHAKLIVDDAHGIGVLGKHGRGICEYDGLSQQDIACLITPLGKAFGSYGALVSGCTSIIDSFLQLARTHRYSTSLPPAIAHATIEAIKIIEQESWRREKLQHLIRFFIRESKKRNLPLISNDETPIKSIMMHSNQMALNMKHYLMQSGFFVSCIRPPTVPHGTSRLRISLNCEHREEQIIHLLDQVISYDESKIKR